MKKVCKENREEENTMISRTLRIGSIIFPATIRRATILLGTIVLVTLACSSAAWADNCSNESLKGTYGFLHGGRDSSGSPVSEAVSQLTFDPSTGTFIASTTTSRDGVISTFSATGTYAIAPDCTGTGTPAGNNPFSFVVTSRGFLVAEPISQTTGFTSNGFAVKQGDAACTNAGVERSFGLQTTGIFLAGAPTTGAVALIADLKLSVNASGKGVISGRMGGSEGETILTLAEEPVTGSYEVETDCTGTATIKAKGLPEMHFSLVVVDCGKEMLAIETDANTIVSATLLKTKSGDKDEDIESSLPAE